MYSRYLMFFKFRYNRYCLGLTISDHLKWHKQVCSMAKPYIWLVEISTTARKLTKTMAYTSLVRPKMEYCSTVWNPHTQKDIDELEKVNRRAARVVNKKSYWERDVSPTELLQDLGWGTLAERRKEHRLTMMYKIKNMPKYSLILKKNNLIILPCISI